MISNDIDASPVLGDAQGMVLHAWTAADITQDQDLDGSFWFRRVIARRPRWVVLRREEEDEDRESRRGAEGESEERVNHRDNCGMT